jgi:hypothetical protein
MKEIFLKSQLKFYKGQLALEEANLENLLSNTVGIGEHTQISDDIDKHVTKIAEIQEKIIVVKNYLK